MAFTLNFTEKEQKILDILNNGPEEKDMLLFTACTEMIPVEKRITMEETYNRLLEMGFIEEKTGKDGEIMAKKSRF